MREEIGKLCRRRRSVIMKSFSYWGEPKPRADKHIYDMRQYVLKVIYLLSIWLSVKNNQIKWLN